MKSLRIIVLMGLFLMLFCGAVLASEEAHGKEAAAGEHGEAAHSEGHEAAGPNWIDMSNEHQPPLVPMFLNFIVVVFAVYFILRKGLGAKIRNRKTELEDALREANALKKEAEEAMAIAKERSDALDVEMAKIRSDILDAAKAQAEQIQKEAADRAERMKAESTALIAQEVAMMSESIRKEVVEEIVAMAEKRIVEKISAADHQKMAKEYVESVMSAVQHAK